LNQEKKFLNFLLTKVLKEFNLPVIEEKQAERRWERKKGISPLLPEVKKRGNGN